MKTIEQIVEFLEANDACENSVDWLENYMDPLLALDECEDEDWFKWLGEKIGSPALAEYRAIEGPAWEMYRQEPNRLAYLAIERPAFEAYRAIQGPARAIYEAIEGPAWAKALPLIKQDIRNWILEE